MMRTSIGSIKARRSSRRRNAQRKAEVDDGEGRDDRDMRFADRHPQRHQVLLKSMVETGAFDPLVDPAFEHLPVVLAIWSPDERHLHGDDRRP